MGLQQIARLHIMRFPRMTDSLGVMTFGKDKEYLVVRPTLSHKACLIDPGSAIGELVCNNVLFVPAKHTVKHTSVISSALVGCQETNEMTTRHYVLHQKTMR